MGLISGIVGGIVVGLLAGSPLQVSGPAAGLAVIVFGFVEQYGAAMLGPVLIVAGLLQVLAGFLKIGSWFRAISPAVVHGMLAGIGILIILGQVHVLMGARPAAGGIENVTAMEQTLGRVWGSGLTRESVALLVGLISLLAMIAWEKFRPKPFMLVPGALVGVAAGTILTVGMQLPITRVEVPSSLIDSISLPTLDGFARMVEPGIIKTTLVIAVIASAETLLSSAAVDRMDDGVWHAIMKAGVRQRNDLVLIRPKAERSKPWPHAAVKPQVCTRYIAGSRTYEESDGISDFLKRSNPSHRDLGKHRQHNFLDLVP